MLYRPHYLKILSKMQQLMKLAKIKALQLSQRRTEYTKNKKVELMQFKDKISLVTGGTSGIGLATANELLRNGASHVFVTGIDRYEGLEAVRKLRSVYGSGKCSYLHLNVISETQFRDIFTFIDKHFGGVDILFNNAGILEDKKWELEVETNFKSIIISNLLGLKYMRKGKGGDSLSQNIIINNADVCALQPMPSAPVYTATKFGVLGATLSFGSNYHFDQTGIRVVGLCCGATNTPMIKHAATKQLKQQWGEDTYDTLTRTRLQKPAAVARGVIYLVKYAPTNTIWTIENSKLYLTKIPHKSRFTYCVTQL